jgi:hypothetical protein
MLLTLTVAYEVKILFVPKLYLQQLTTNPVMSPLNPVYICKQYFFKICYYIILHVCIVLTNTSRLLVWNLVCIFMHMNFPPPPNTVLYFISPTVFADSCKSRYSDTITASSRQPQSLLSAFDSIGRRLAHASPRMTNWTVVEANYWSRKGQKSNYPRCKETKNQSRDPGLH